MTVIDAPTREPIVLDETILDDLLPCHHADAGAAWNWTLRCCGASAYLCTAHDARSRHNLALACAMEKRIVCVHCKHSFGNGPAFETVILRTPI